MNPVLARAVLMMICDLRPEQVSAIADSLTALAALAALYLAWRGVRTWSKYKMQERQIAAVHAFNTGAFTLSVQLGHAHDLGTDLLNHVNAGVQDGRLNVQLTAIVISDCDRQIGDLERVLTLFLASWYEVEQMSPGGVSPIIHEIEQRVLDYTRTVRELRSSLATLTTEWNRDVLAAAQENAKRLSRSPDPVGEMVRLVASLREPGKVLIEKAYSTE